MSIVFGTTLNPECRPLAELAALLAQRLDLPLRLVHVCEDARAPVVLGTDEEHILGPVRAALDEEAQRLHSLVGGVVHPHLAAGSVVDALVSVAEFEFATLLVIGGGQNAGRSLLGATAERAAAKSVVPLLTLREPSRVARWLHGESPLRVLVGADLGRNSEAARAFAAGLGQLGACEFEVVYVVSPLEAHERLGLAPPQSDHVLSEEAESALLRSLTRSAPAEESAAQLRVLPARGSADAHLVTLADQGDFDLVVVGQRRHSMLNQIWYASVSRGVLRAAPVSVACVPPPLGAPQPALRAPRVIVVGVGFSEVDQRALSQAIGWVAGEGGTVHLAHVLAPTLTASEIYRMREHAGDALSKLLCSELTAEPPVEIERHVLEGDAAEQLLALAERVDADLMVLGARRRPAIHRMVIGSVARAVCARADLPVLTVPLPRA